MFGYWLIVSWLFLCFLCFRSLVNLTSFYINDHDDDDDGDDNYYYYCVI